MDNKKITRAVISAAGYGTRFLPETKTIQKEMLPVLNRPVIDYVVDDAIKAGIEEIIFIVKPSDTQIRNFYSESKEIYAYLEKMGKLDKYPDLQKLHEKAKFTFVVQQPDEIYGTATPLKLAYELVKNEAAFVVLMGDDFVYHQDGSSETARMIDTFNRSGSDGLVSFVTKPKNEVSKYGIAKFAEKNGYKRLLEIVEKPEINVAPSNLANISKYIFQPDIFEIIMKQQINPILHELLITDTISQYINTGKSICIHTTQGQYLDCGSIAGWLNANLTLAENNPSLKNELETFS